MEQNVYTLLCKRDLPMALVTIPQIVSFMADGQKLIVFDDGSFDDETVETILQISPAIEVITLKQREELVTGLLTNYPNCLKYRDEFPLAFKMLDIPLIVINKGEERFTFTDSDILYLNQCQQYFTRSTNTYLKTDAIKLSVKLQNVLLKYRWKIPVRFNSGYFSFNVKDFDLEFINHYLGLPDVRNMPWLSEQTCWALLFGKAGNTMSPAENEFVCQEIFDGPKSDTLAIHLIGKLKNKYVDWSAVKPGLVKQSITPAFSPSRNINISDWVIKTVKKYSQSV